jgi:hypothetical protein
MRIIQNSKKQLSENDKNENLSRGHKDSVSRRHFLAKGVGAGLGFALMPSALSLLSRRVEAQSLSCASPLSTASSMMPLLFIDFAGGAALGTDFTVGGVGGQLDFLTGTGAYENFALPDELNYNAMSITPDTSFGVAFHPSSPLMLGIKSTLPSQYWPSVDGFIVAGVTNDDTQNNRIGGLQYAGLVGRKGLIVPHIGTEAKASGGYHEAADNAEVSELMPVRVTDQNSARRIGGFGNMFENNRLGATRAQRVLESLNRLSSSQIDQFNRLSLDEQTNVLVRCGYVNAIDLPSLHTPEAIFPLTPAGDDPLRTAFGGNFAGRSASLARLLMNDFSGAACEVLGGHDGHNGTALDPNNARFQAGALIGRYIHYAALLNKPLYIVGTTDGSMGVLRENGILQTDSTAAGANAVGGQGFARWPGDNENVSTQFALVFVPGSGRGDLISSAGRQIGGYRPQGVMRDYLITAGSPTRVAQVMMYNYLILQGREADITKIAGGTNPFEGSNESKYRVLKRAPGA